MRTPSPARRARPGVSVAPHPPARIVERVVGVFVRRTRAALAKANPPSHAASNWVRALSWPFLSTEGMNMKTMPTPLNASGKAHHRLRFRGLVSSKMWTLRLKVTPSQPRIGPKSSAQQLSKAEA